MKWFKKIREDCTGYDRHNTSEEIVYKAHFFAGYKGAFILMTPFRMSFSCGVIGLSRYQKKARILRHEYGHYLQLKQRGWFRYIKEIVLYSVTENLLYRKGKLPYDYYGSPWEAEADRLGGVENCTECTPWPSWLSGSYKEMLRLFRK